MNSRTFQSILIIIFSLFIIFSCSKDEKSPIESESPQNNYTILANSNTTIEISDDFMLEIPSGTIDNDAPISIKEIETLDGNSIEGLQQHGKIFRIIYNGEPLKNNVMIYFKIPENIPKEDLLVCRYNGTEWEILKTYYSENKNMIVAETPGFSDFTSYSGNSIKVGIPKVTPSEYSGIRIDNYDFKEDLKVSVSMTDPNNVIEKVKIKISFRTFESVGVKTLQTILDVVTSATNPLILLATPFIDEDSNNPTAIFQMEEVDSKIFEFTMPKDVFFEMFKAGANFDKIFIQIYAQNKNGYEPPSDVIVVPVLAVARPSIQLISPQYSANNLPTFSWQWNLQDASIEWYEYGSFKVIVDNSENPFKSWSFKTWTHEQKIKDANFNIKCGKELNLGDTYSWGVILSKDNSWGNSDDVRSEILSFSVNSEGNSPPNAPTTPNPAYGATYQETNLTLSWECTDPDGDPLTFDVYLGTDNIPHSGDRVSMDQSEKMYFASNLNENTTYYWKIVAKDNYGNTFGGNVWHFTTLKNLVGGGPCPGIETVLYEGKIYNTIQIGDQCWMKENLDVGTRINSNVNMQSGNGIEKYCYDDDPNNCDKYGGLYRWDEAMRYTTTEGTQGICPNGWQIPTAQDYRNLGVFVGKRNSLNYYTGSNNLKSVGEGSGEGSGNNSSGFSAVSGGLIRDNGAFDYLGTGITFWTSTVGNSNYLTNMALHYDKDIIIIDPDRYSSNFGLSIRCLKNEGTISNSPPNKPSNPTPSTGATNQETSLTLNWDCLDPDGDPLIYDLYFGTSSNPALAIENLNEDNFPIGALGGTKYYWKIVAKDDHGNTTEGDVWDFTTKSSSAGEINITNPNSSTVWTQGQQNVPIEWETGNLGGDVEIWLWLDDGGLPNNTQLTSSTPNDGSFSTWDVPEDIQPNTNYKIRIYMVNNSSIEDNSEKFEIKANSSPNKPSNPNPADGVDNQETSLNLSWDCSDPEGDPLTFDIHFGTTSLPPLVENNHSEKSYNPGILDENTKYYWKVVAKDDHDNAVVGDVWEFTTKSISSNQSPIKPYNPNPIDGATNQATSLSFSWDCSDPDGDPLKYDIYFGTSANPNITGSNSTLNSFAIVSTLDKGTKYYWKIVAKDDHGNETEGDVWEFTTISNNNGGGEPCPDVAKVYYEGGPNNDAGGNYYNTVLIGEQCWLKENLDVGTMILGSEDMADNNILEKYCYDNDPNNCETYGGLYQWNEAMQYLTAEGARGICPDGWHLPTEGEWETIGTYINDEAVKLIDQSVTLLDGYTATNETGFSALAAGALMYDGQSVNFIGLELGGYLLWSSTEYDINNYAIYTTPTEHYDFELYNLKKNYGAGIRCLKD